VKETSVTSSNDRRTSVLDRPAEPQPAMSDGPGVATATAAPSVRAPQPSRRAAVVHRPEPQGRPAKPLPRGWGSHEERRTALWFLAGFFLLGLYAAVFVTLGQVVWS
jgi:hypothetical protein